jgi:hypothetical protein
VVLTRQGSLTHSRRRQAAGNPLPLHFTTAHPRLGPPHPRPAPPACPDREWSACLQQLPSTQPAGCLQLRADAFKSSSLAALGSAQTTIGLLLAGAARQRGAEALQELQAWATAAAG